MPEEISPSTCSVWGPPLIDGSFLALKQAMWRRKYGKVEYLCRRYCREYPAYEGFYLEQEGLAHRERGYGERALECFRRADAFFGGRCITTRVLLIRQLRMLKRLAEAGERLREALPWYPKNDPLLLEGVHLLEDEGRLQDALRLLREHCPECGMPDFWRLRAQYCLELGLYEESREAFAVCHERWPLDLTSWALDLFYMHYMPDLTLVEIGGRMEQWREVVSALEPPTPPALLRRATDPRKKLRIGIVAAGLCMHPVGWMSAHALRCLSRLSGYELYFYHVPDEKHTPDFLYRTFRAAASAWRNAQGWDADRLYRRLLDDKLDLALDLCGVSEGFVLHLFARRVAPVQISWVGGLVNTTGVPAMDYLLSDRYETPDGCDSRYTEKLVRLPHSYISYTPPDYGPATDVAPRPEDAPICFGCFNNARKLNADIAGVWAEILRRTPGSTLFLKTPELDNRDIRERTLALFTARGVDADRIRWEGRSPHVELLRRYDEVDIALDPWPYSGGLTTLEALWKGVPVITMPGPTFAGRHAMSHLLNLGLGSLVVESFEAYADLATLLAGNRGLLRELRYLLPYSMLTSPLIRPEQMAADLDTAFRAMWQRHCEGLPPVAMRFEQPSPIPEELKPLVPETEQH